jgi:predicted esterase
MRKINGYFRTMEHKLEAKKTYRFEYQETAKNHEHPKVLIALHGYGQLAKYFIRKFEVLKETYVVVCPEGPHRFYLQGSSGRVGASWMTKEAREMDIEDNMNWLDEVLEHLKLRVQPASISLLGFSQGAATAARWYQRNPSAFDQLILWATVFPPDLDAGTFPRENPMHFVLGSEDEYYQGEAAEQLKETYKTLGFEVHSFEGTHDLHGGVLSSILLT